MSTEFPLVDQSTTLVILPNGEIRLESGAEGLWILFDAPCLEALPYCKAQCCACNGILLTEDEVEEYKEQSIPIDWHPLLADYEMKRSSDGFCNQLDRQTRTCKIYEYRPHTCQTFHCTRGALQRGWKLDNAPNRLAG